MNTILKTLIATGVVATSITLAPVANALSLFNFSYEFVNYDNGEEYTLAGQLEGDILDDGDTVSVSSILNTTLNGEIAPEINMIATISGLTNPSSSSIPSVSFSGDFMDLFAVSVSESLVTGFGFITTSDGSVFSSGAGYGDIGEGLLYDPNNWTLSAVSGATPVPTPAAVLAPLFSMGIAAVRKRKQDEAEA